MKTNSVTSAFQNAKLIVNSIRSSSRREDLNQTEQEALGFIDTQGRELSRLGEISGRACWDLFVLGGEKRSTRKKNEGKKVFEARIEKLQEKYGDAVKKAEAAYIDYKNNPENAMPVIEIHAQLEEIREQFIRRQIRLAYPGFFEFTVDPALEKQIASNTTDLSTMYGDFKANFKGKKLDNEKIEYLLRKLKGHENIQDVIDLVKARLAIGNHRLKDGGPTVAELVLETIKLRNQFARKAGGENGYSYSLKKQEINEEKLVGLREEVKRVLKPVYERLRARMDAAAVKRYGISREDARLPWFQCGVSYCGLIDDVLKFDPDRYFKGMDPRPLMKATARKIGGSAAQMMNRSDLFPRPGKTPHWYMFPLSVPDDIRTIGNMDPNFKRGMGRAFSTEFHEAIGHGVGYSFVDAELPPLLRELHTITTESDAMMMEDLMYNMHWLREVAKFDDDTIDIFLNDGKQYRLAERLQTFFQNYLLIPDMEREMYRMSDNELTLTNVNKLWREKVYEYQGIKIPEDRNEPDWTYKIHFATAPVYYQDYFLGQLARAQNTAKIVELNGERRLLDKGTGDFLKTYRGVGVSYPWDELVEHMTGKPLGVDALQREFEELKI